MAEEKNDPGADPDISEEEDSDDEVSLLVVDENELQTALEAAGIGIKVCSSHCWFAYRQTAVGPPMTAADMFSFGVGTLGEPYCISVDCRKACVAVFLCGGCVVQRWLCCTFENKSGATRT